jgi:hypothetical protein
MTKHARRKTLADPAAARPRCLARAKQRSLARAAFTVGRSVRAPSRKSLQETPRPRPRSRAAGKASPRGCGSRTSTTLKEKVGKGGFDPYVATWTVRRDLAEKAARSNQYVGCITRARPIWSQSSRS